MENKVQNLTNILGTALDEAKPTYNEALEALGILTLNICLSTKEDVTMENKHGKIVVTVKQEEVEDVEDVEDAEIVEEITE